MKQFNVQPFAALVRPPVIYAGSFPHLLWPLLTSSCFVTVATGSPLVRASSFLRFLQHLHSLPSCILWASQGCDCLPGVLCLLCRSCSSVPDFAVPLPSVSALRLTTLRLANTSGCPRRIGDFHPLEICTPVVAPKNLFVYLYFFNSLQQVCAA